MNIRNSLFAVLMAVSLPVALPALAQTAAPATTPAAKDMAQAEVRKIDKDSKKITLKHGEIKNLDMPPMTMSFQVSDVALLEKIAVGDKIIFSAEKIKGAYVVTDLKKADK